MSIIRWDPLREMMVIHRDMDALFENVASSERGDRLPRTVGVSPPIEIEERENKIHLRLEMPSVDPKDLDIRIMQAAVCVSGERRTNSKVKQSEHRHSESYYGKFSRTFPLPTSVDDTKVKAGYKDGMLTLDLPKLEHGARSVRVNASLGSD